MHLEHFTELRSYALLRLHQINNTIIILITKKLLGTIKVKQKSKFFIPQELTFFQTISEIHHVIENKMLIWFLFQMGEMPANAS